MKKCSSPPFRASTKKVKAGSLPLTPQILTMNLLEGQPRLIDETLKIVEWNVRFDILPEVQVYRKDRNQVYPITDFDTRGLIRDGAIHGTLRTQFTNEWRPVQFIPENSLS